MSIEVDSEWLSFSGSFTSYPSPTEPSNASDLPLRPWIIWDKAQMPPSEKDFSRGMRVLGKFNSVHEFWKCFLSIPQPSELLEGSKYARAEEGPSGGGEIVDNILIFRKGIKPEWEDEANKYGGHFLFNFKSSISPMQLDEYWNNLILGMVGCSFSGAELINGVRLVDKTSGRAPVVRFEVWFRDYDNQQAVQSLKQAVENCMGTKVDETVGNTPRSEIKSHQDS
jgi:translation initiation factor 4E